MGARLVYAKVIDRENFYLKEGGRVHPGLPNQIVLQEEPGIAGAFLVLRAWSNDHGTFTEQWRIEGSGGGKIYESLPRELHLPTQSHIEKLEDEVTDLEFQYASDDHELVLLLDDREVARTRFSVRVLE